MLELSLPIQQGIVIGVTLLLVILLVLEKTRPSYLFFVAVLIFLLTGIIKTNDFLNAMSNEAILSIFLLIFITAGLREHFNLAKVLDKIFGKTNNPRSFIVRMTSGVATMSSILNNTPIVALLMPYVYQWSAKNNIAPSKLLIPLSYAAIIGGMITVIGTSTNLVLNGLIISKGAQPLLFFDFLIPGLLVSIGGILFMYLFGLRLLPDRRDRLKEASHSREYLVQIKVLSNSKLIGKSVTEANLRNLKGIYLFEIVRETTSITPIDPEEVLQAHDILFFAGDTHNVVELLAREEGLAVPTTDDTKDERNGHNLIEAVIPFNSELVNRTLKEIEFRENYDAAVVAVHRNGEKLRGKIGEIILQAGDLLLISAGHNFHNLLKSKPTLYLLSVLSNTKASSSLARKGFGVVVAFLIGMMAFGQLSLFISLLLLISYMTATKLFNLTVLKKELDIDLAIILVTSLTFSVAIIDSGTADLIAQHFITTFQRFGNLGILIGLYLITLLMTTFVTNVAAVSIVFPIAYALGSSMPGVDMAALFLAIAFAASASFHAPFSYQTNLMVFGPGDYKYTDFLRIGIPFTLLYSIIALVFIALYYNF